MVEARLTLANGVTSPISIPDLGLILRLGEVRWADEQRARKSICVEALIRAGKIRVSYERRNKKPMSNPTPKPSIHSVTMSRPATRVLTVAGAPSAPSATSAPATSAAAGDPFNYFVQAGAFRTPEDAEQQRIKLSLMGLPARVSEREQSGRIVYRVRLGPFDKKDDADKVKVRLDTGGLEATLVRVQK
jgi:cell division protein FtsN